MLRVVKNFDGRSTHLTILREPGWEDEARRGAAEQQQ